MQSSHVADSHTPSPALPEPKCDAKDAPSERERVEPIINDQVRKTIDALGGHLLEESLERLHEVHERHPVQPAEVAVHHSLVALPLPDCTLDVAERPPDVGDGSSVVQDRGLRLIGKRLDAPKSPLIRLP